MTRIALVADVHLANHRKFPGQTVSGLNQRAREALSVLANSVQLALAEKCAAYVVLGDLLDVDRPEPQLIAAAQDIFAHARDSGMPVYLMLGNHEQQSASEGDHALGPFRPVATVIEQPTVVDIAGVSLGLIPFRTGAASAWLEKAVRDLFTDVPPFGGGRVLGVHLGIADDDTPAFLKSAHDAIHVTKLMDAAREVNVTQVFAGNWHNRARWMGTAPDPNVFQVGALVPTGWDNPGLRGYGGVALYDSADESVRIDTLPGPRYVKADSLDELEKLANLPTKHTSLYVASKLPRADILAGLSVLDELKTSGKVVAGGILPDDEEAREASRAAARAAATSTSLDEALANYIEKMDPGEGVARAEVLRLSQTYLDNKGTTP